jgi:hypothetical protein
MADANIGLTTNGDTSWFCAVNGTEWEVFLGTRVNATTLARTTVFSSSNAGSAVNFTSAPVVFSTVPGTKINYGPAFSAIKNATQSVPATTFTKVEFQTKEFDTDLAFDAVTNYRFQPNIAGYYQISGRIGTTAPFSANSLVLIYKNGTAFKPGVQVNSSSYGLNVSALIYMNGSSDYIELYAYLGSALTLAGTTDNYFQGAMIRPA